MEKNILIETWKTGANAIAKAYEMYGRDYKEQLKNLASSQLVEIQESRPDKSKTTEEQCNEMQLELVNYLKKVKETGEI